MNEIIKIGNHEIMQMEFKGKRVVTLKDIDLVHERPEGTARKRFNDNKERFLMDEDYFKVSPSEFRTAGGEMDIRQQNDITLITESGYLMLVKSFTDDLAWDVQRQLVNTYFRKKKTLSFIEMLELEFAAVKEVNSRVDAVNKELQEFKQELPLLGLEGDKITAAIHRKGVHCLGGKNSNAYRDNRLRGKLYSDLYRELYRQFDVTTYKALKRNQCEKAVGVIESYKPPIVLAEEIEGCNAQLNL